MIPKVRIHRDNIVVESEDPRARLQEAQAIAEVFAMNCLEGTDDHDVLQVNIDHSDGNSVSYTVRQVPVH